MRTHRTPDEWRSLFDEQQRSGLNKTQFCRQHGITRSAFSNAHHRLFDRNATDVSFVLALPPSLPDTKPANTPRSGLAATNPQLTLSLPGATLSLPVDISPRWLATLLREIAP